MTHKVTPAVRELYIGVMGPSGPNDQALIRSGHFDNTSVMQLLARFEAETVERCAEKMKAAISYGYEGPDGTDQCEHGRFRWEDCITCYDESLMLAADNLITGD